MAELVFGHRAGTAARRQVWDLLTGWGYKAENPLRDRLLCTVLLHNRTAQLEQLPPDAVTRAKEALSLSRWQYYDLGHGLCTYTFFEQCPHRMACAKCDFYTPKQFTKADILAAKTNLQRMSATIELTEDELAAVEDGQAALDGLLARLVDEPTPDAAPADDHGR